MSGTSSKSYIVKAGLLHGKQQILSFTKKMHIRLNATRLNPRREEKGQPVTKGLGQLYDYIYMITDQENITLPNGEIETLDIIKGFKFKPWDSEEVTAYIQGVTPPEEAEAHE